MAVFTIQSAEGRLEQLDIPDDMGLSLMEVLKASDYPILATCGGMALCATCRVEVEQGLEQLDSPGDAELDMLDTLPDASSKSRLACQIRIGEQLNGLLFRLPG